ncbi:MAG: geranylgeranylglycerol-phosphate geranylgeranyltransferase [Bacteroidia bacterium]|nr:geranylgeranylglycerol-phosphate geranylgeranyltransferase [Bacteroidia bacterium]
MLRDLRYFIQISRPVNVFISLLAFAVSCMLANHGSLHFVTNGGFWATALTIAFIAATGYWINDVYDFRIDRINKPSKTVVNAILSVKKVMTMYLFTLGGIITFTGLVIGWYMGYYHITFINALSMLLLFVYASYLKRIGVAGNLTISFLIALVILLAGYLYELTIPLIWAMVFAFEITLIREITKDVEDIRGDLSFQLRTLPIQIGIRQTKYVLLGLYLAFIFSTYLPVAVQYWKSGDLLWMYLLSSLLLVQAPAAYLIWRMIRSSDPRDFSFQSQGLKLVMVLGMVTLFFL